MSDDKTNNTDRDAKLSRLRRELADKLVVKAKEANYDVDATERKINGHPINDESMFHFSAFGAGAIQCVVGPYRGGNRIRFKDDERVPWDKIVDAAWEYVRANIAPTTDPTLQARASITAGDALGSVSLPTGGAVTIYADGRMMLCLPVADIKSAIRLSASLIQ